MIGFVMVITGLIMYGRVVGTEDPLGVIIAGSLSGVGVVLVHICAVARGRRAELADAAHRARRPRSSRIRPTRSRTSDESETK